jgi:hypothetical protein
LESYRSEWLLKDVTVGLEPDPKAYVAQSSTAIPAGSRSAVTMTASSSSIESAKICRGVRAHTGEVSTVYLMDVDIEKLVKVLSEKRN